MLVIQGFFENGVFTPNEPALSVKGRHEATLTIQDPQEQDPIEENETQEQIRKWTEILEDLRNCEEELTGEPERIHFRTPEEIDKL